MATTPLLVVLLSCYFIITGAQKNGDVRLQGGNTPYTGRVEVYLDSASTWGTVEYDSYIGQKGAAQTICTQLGYGAATNYGTVGNLGIPVAGNGVPVLLSEMYCSYNSNPYNADQHILRCSYKSPLSFPDHTNDMAVTCSSTPDRFYFYNTQVRLVQRNSSSSGFQSSSGFLEVYLNGKWGPVCNMENYDVNTACRQLGYTGADVYSDSIGYQGVNPNKLSSFYCSWSNACLRNCFSYPTSDSIFSCSRHTQITCTFDQDETYLTSGSSLLCFTDDGTLVALAVGIVIAVLFLLVLVIAVPVLVCCCCIPGCIINSSRKRGGYYVVS